jgi:ribosome recycling factor
MHKITEDFKKKSDSVVENFRKDIAVIRSNRPNPGLIENLKVSYYEQLVPLKQIGSISVEPPRELRLQVWDKEVLPQVLKAIESANLGVSANVDGMNVRIFLPELSEERRKELGKYVRQIAEKVKIQLRRERDEANKAIERALKANEIGEDLKFKLKDEIQKQTDKTNEEIEKVLESKMREINE